MFGNKKNNHFAKGGHTLFDRALEVTGKVVFGGTLDIEGKVVGDVYAAEGADALVRIFDKGYVEGEIRAPKVIINGKVTGDVHSSKHLELASNAIVNGNVHYSVIEMVKGAEVNGSLIHIEEAAAGANANSRAKAATKEPMPAKVKGFNKASGSPEEAM